MLLCFLGVGAQASSPFPFPSFGSLKFNPPLTPRYLCLFYHSPPSSLTSITATAAAATTTPLNPQNKDLLADYLVNILEFKRNEAINVSMQVNPSKPSGNPILVLNLLLHYGLTKIQIQNIVSSFPDVLNRRADRTLEPKLKFFLQELGFSGSDFVKLIQKNPGLLSRGLDTCIIPTVNYLKEALGGDENVVEIVRDSPWLMSSPSALKRLQLNVTMLRNYGIANEVIKKIIISNPRNLLQKPERFKDALSRVERELGIPRDSPMLFRGVCALASVSKAALQMRVNVFKSFGWTDLDITNMSRSQPFCLSMSEDRMRRALTFLMKELGYTSEYLASHACFLMYSMENRVKPRYEVLKILKEKKLVDDKPGLYSLVIASESTFLQKHVLCYLDEVPNLYEIYKNSIDD